MRMKTMPKMILKRWMEALSKRSNSNNNKTKKYQEMVIIIFHLMEFQDKAQWWRSTRMPRFGDSKVTMLNLIVNIQLLEAQRWKIIKTNLWMHLISKIWRKEEFTRALRILEIEMILISSWERTQAPAP
jgi:hypothetical protein